MDLTGYIRAWERRHPDLVVSELNKQLQEKLDEWEEYLVWAEARPDLDRPYPEEEGYEEEDYMEGVSDFCWFRDMLQYAMLGIYHIKHERFDRLRGVKIAAFERRILELDKRFRKVMRNKRGLSIFWADRSCWWHHPPRRRI